MKKFFKYAGMAAIALAFGACSSDVVVAPNATNPAFDAEGNGYLKIAINLPTATATRGIGDLGDEYGNFNDGSKYEYAVENAILVLFSGSGNDEMTYTLQSAYQLNSGEWNMEDGENPDGVPQITNKRTIIQQINNAGATGDLYAYVILNKHSFFEVLNNEQVKNHLSFNGTQGTKDLVDENTTLADFMKLEINESGRRYDANSFLMTNMPYASKAGAGTDPSGATIKTLYPVNGSAIYPSYDEAATGTAVTEVNVERVLAKVETSWTYPAGQSDFTTEDGNNYHAEILGWFIDNTNKTSYVARNYEAPDGVGLGYLGYRSTRTGDLALTPTYRFVSGSPVTAGAYRTFWAIDPNYNIEPAQNEMNALLNEGGKFVDNRLMKYNADGTRDMINGGRLRANGAYYYCTENTFDVAHQSHYNTTRVVVAADFGDAFYTIAQEAGKKYDQTNLENYIKSRIAERVHFMEWVEDYLKGGVDGVKFISVKINNHNETAGAVEITIDDTPAGITDADIKDDKTLNDALIAYKNDVADASDGDNTYLKNNYQVSYYKDGVAYYSALIQHFGEYETPWSAAWYAGKENTVNGVYAHTPATDDFDHASYLGRYGVVRNNWYKINIQGIRKIGSAVVPELKGTDPDTPDDQVENYLKVKINITPWAIRKQNVKL